MADPAGELVYPKQMLTVRKLVRRNRHLLNHILLALVSLPMMFPFYWMIATSLKTPYEVALNPPAFFRSIPSLAITRRRLPSPAFPHTSHPRRVAPGHSLE